MNKENAVWNLLTNCIEIIFEAGLFINALLFIPQIIKLLNNRHANDVSLLTFAGFNVINVFILLHGIIMHDLWLTIGYLLTVIANTTVTVLIICIDDK